jgi:hypothetical protein
VKKISIIIPYFGSWPKWFNVFLKTCKYNTTIDWFFFTNCEKPNNAPENTHFVKMTMEEFEKKSSKKTGVNVDIKRGYKICDFRPAFGDIFEGYIRKYDFWGWGDIDVVYGNLKSILTPYRLNKYSIISVRRYRTAGVLSVLKNSSYMKKLYRKSPDYEKVFSSEKGFAFDEAGKFKNRRVFSFTDVVKNQNINYHFWDHTITDKNKEKENLDLYWKDGRLYDMEYGAEVGLYHFVDRKKDDKFEINQKIDVSSGFSIKGNGIHEEKSPRTIQRKPLRIVEKKVKDTLRWVKDRVRE